MQPVPLSAQSWQLGPGKALAATHLAPLPIRRSHCLSVVQHPLSLVNPAQTLRPWVVTWPCTIDARCRWRR